MLPPALSPATAMRAGSAPSSAACAAAQRVACKAILDPGREFVLGREAVIDRDDDASRAGAQIAAHAVMRVEAAQHKAAAVKEHQQRKRARAVRRIDAEAQRPARPIDRLLADSCDLGGRRHQRDARLVLRARHIDRQGMRRGHPGALVEQRLDLRIDRHRLSPSTPGYCAALASGARGPAESGRAPGPAPCRAVT